MKKIAVLTVMLLVLLGNVVVASSMNGTFKDHPVVKLLLNGDEIQPEDVPAIIFDDRTMVPFYLLEKLGITATWDKDTYTVKATKTADNREALRRRLDEAAKNKEIVSAVGDSITKGIEYDDYIFKHFPGVIPSADMGVDRNTTKDVINRLDTIVKTKAKVYLVAIGINDIRYNDPDIGATTGEEFKNNMTIIIDRLKENADVFVVGIWPTYAPDNRIVLGVDGANKRIDEWNIILEDLCKEKGVPFIATTQIIRNQIQTDEEIKALTIDGLHPNDSGRIIYANAVLYGGLTTR